MPWNVQLHGQQTITLRVCPNNLSLEYVCLGTSFTSSNVMYIYMYMIFLTIFHY